MWYPMASEASLNLSLEPKIRVMVVDDSRVQREMLILALSQDPQLEVVGSAGSGVEAIAQFARLNVDVVTMDLRMPHMDGLETASALLKIRAVPILMVTGSVSRFDQKLVARALELGILAVTHKPSSGEDFNALRQLVKGLSKVRLVRRSHETRPETRQETQQYTRLEGLNYPGVRNSPRELDLSGIRIVGLVASTGGPQVLEKLLRGLPAHFPLPLLVVQHIASGFAQSMVDWLNPLCQVPVRLAERGRTLEPGVWFASENHLTVQTSWQHTGQVYTLSNSLEMPVDGHRPSGTVLLRSLAREYGSAALGAVLTGMGEDGAAGLRELRSSGGLGVAQDPSSATIASMPRAAIRDGVDAVLNPAELLSLLERLASVTPR